jgi:acetyltransferase-like isoleucine patch superfamily enzyme
MNHIDFVTSVSNVVYPGIIWEGKFVIGAFSVLGQPPQGLEPNTIETRFGENALIRSHTVIYAGNKIGRNFQTGHGVMIRELNQIGDNVSIGTHSIVEHHVTIGDNVRIHSNVFIPEYCILEDECWIGPSVVMTNAIYPRSRNVKNNLKGVVVQKGAKIGAGAVLLPGVNIGMNAIIGAGAVVVRNVEANAVVVGNPARLINLVTNIPEYTPEELL